MFEWSEILRLLLSGNSWVLGDIMPGIVRHHNPTEEHGENTT